MEFIVRDVCEVPLYVPPPAWSGGQEKFLVHGLVEADADALEQVWQMRKSPAGLGAFVLRRGVEHVSEQLALRCEVARDRFDDILGHLDEALPERHSLWPRLDPAALPALAWHRVEQLVAGCRRLKELDAPPILIEAQTRWLSQLALVLLEPERAGFGAGYDSLPALLQDALGFAVRQPLRDRGLGEDVEALTAKQRAALSRKASPRAFSALETYFVIDREDAARLTDRLLALRPKNDEEDSVLAELLKSLAQVTGVHLMSITKWKDYVLASGYDLGPSELTGVFQVCTR